MKLSARNVLPGTVTKVTRGAVNAEVHLALKSSDKIVSVITNGSAEELGLKEGEKRIGDHQSQLGGSRKGPSRGQTECS